MPQLAPSVVDFASLAVALQNSQKPLCLFSGGLDGAYLLLRLRAALGAGGSPIALTVDLGGNPDYEGIAQVCELTNTRSIIDSARRTEFLDDYVAPAIAAQARYLGGHPVCASLSRPLMAKAAVETAMREGCDLIIHTSTRSQNSLRRINGAIAHLAQDRGFAGVFGSPFASEYLTRTAKMRELERAGLLRYGSRHCSFDSNLWGREFESGRIDDVENVDLELLESLYEWTKVRRSVGESETITIEFVDGAPIAMDRQEMSLDAIVADLNDRVGKFGKGRSSGLEETESGHKVFEVREMPAAEMLLDAYRDIESACLSSKEIRHKMVDEQIWVEEAAEGRWFGQARVQANERISGLSKRVTGGATYLVSTTGVVFRGFVDVPHPKYVRDRRQIEDRARATS